MLADTNTRVVSGSPYMTGSAAERLVPFRTDARAWTEPAGEAARSLPMIKALHGARLIVSETPAFQDALTLVEQVAPTPATVLLLGETGAGKEVFAQAIHHLSPRRQRQMVRVSCAAIPAALIESELFGRERGAFTGARDAADRPVRGRQPVHALPGRDWRASRRTSRSKLLRVLQERVIERLGSTQPIKVDVRVVAATNRNLEKAVEDRIVP